MWERAPERRPLTCRASLSTASGDAARPSSRYRPSQDGRAPLLRSRAAVAIPRCDLSVESRRKEVPVIKQAPVKGRKAVKVSFVLPRDAVAGNVSVVGDFNGWDSFVHPL